MKSEQNIVKLYQFSSAWGLPNPSPFCMKLETYLRMAEIPYEIVPNADIRKAPKGKMPYIMHNGKILGDSGLIIEYLKSVFPDQLDKDLSISKKALALAITRLFEDHLNWIIMYSRWVESEGWEEINKTFFSSLPLIMRNILPTILRKRVLRDLNGHGIGRHTKDEIFQMGKADLIAISHLLNDQKFFLGNNPTSLDAMAYGFLANIMGCPVNSPLKECALTLDNLIAFCNRMKEKYYS